MSPELAVSHNRDRLDVADERSSSVKRHGHWSASTPGVGSVRSAQAGGHR